ncbi:MAG: hypothetical protein NWQ07_01940 [Flaviramulus sp.]|nr:hypothetical protein [Flaviramulus sp.]
MSLFQNSVKEKFLNILKKEVVLEKWTIYKNHFLNPGIQENIRNSKEEQYKGEFLIDLLVNVLGYTKNPTLNFQRTNQRKFELETLPKKSQDWYLLSYTDFMKELAKLKIKLTLFQEVEWEDYFTT